MPNINRSQLPPTLELAPGEGVPEGFAYLLEAKPNAEGEYEVENPSQSTYANATRADEEAVEVNLPCVEAKYLAPT